MLVCFKTIILFSFINSVFVDLFKDETFLHYSLHNIATSINFFTDLFPKSNIMCFIKYCNTAVLDFLFLVSLKMFPSAIDVIHLLFFKRFPLSIYFFSIRLSSKTTSLRLFYIICSHSPFVLPSRFLTPFAYTEFRMLLLLFFFYQYSELSTILSPTMLHFYTVVFIGDFPIFMFNAIVVNRFFFLKNARFACAILQLTTSAVLFPSLIILLTRNVKLFAFSSLILFTVILATDCCLL